METSFYMSITFKFPPEFDLNFLFGFPASKARRVVLHILVCFMLHLNIDVKCKRVWRIVRPAYWFEYGLKTRLIRKRSSNEFDVSIRLFSQPFSRRGKKETEKEKWKRGRFLTISCRNMSKFQRPSDRTFFISQIYLTDWNSNEKKEGRRRRRRRNRKRKRRKKEIAGGKM